MDEFVFNTDKQELINKCLECDKPVCDNCLSYKNRMGKPRHNYTESEMEIILNRDLDDEYVMQHVDISKFMLYNLRRQKYGTGATKTHKWTEDELLYCLNHSYKECQAKFGVSISSISTAKRRAKMLYVRDSQ